MENSYGTVVREKKIILSHHKEKQGLFSIAISNTKWNYAYFRTNVTKKLFTQTRNLIIN